MSNKLPVKIILIVLAAANLFACASIKKNFPKAERPFQERSFDSKLWIAGDAQTRGEMVKDLQWNETGKISLRTKTQLEIIKLLGEPDKKQAVNAAAFRAREKSKSGFTMSRRKMLLLLKRKTSIFRFILRKTEKWTNSELPNGVRKTVIISRESANLKSIIV